VTDNATALEMLEAAGVDPAEVVRVNPKQFIDTLNRTDVNPSAVIDREEHTYYRQDE